jgi:hypothetical protein
LFDPASDITKTAIYLGYYGSALIINSYGDSAMVYTKMMVEGAATGTPQVTFIKCSNYETTGAALIVDEMVPVRTKTDTGDIATGLIEGLIEINTFDNKVKIYADGAWRQIATW